MTPSPTAITICFSGTVVTSPGAKILGTVVSQGQFTITSPALFSLTSPLTRSELGTSPISTNIPVISRALLTPVFRSLTLSLLIVSCPVTSSVWYSRKTVKTCRASLVEALVYPAPLPFLAYFFTGLSGGHFDSGTVAQFGPENAPGA